MLQSAMTFLDISSLTIHDQIPNDAVDVDNVCNRYLQKLENYAKSLPYPIEPNSKMQEILDLILLRITQCVNAMDYDPGLIQWDSMLSYWTMLKFPIPKQKRIKLVKLYFHLCTTPGMPCQIVGICAETLQSLTRSKKKLSIEDMRLPWKPIYDILSQDLFLSRRQFEYTQLTWYMGYIADITRRFFHPAATNEMLSTFVPLINGTNLDTLLASQYYLLTFLPPTHPQSYLPMLFRLWESVNSYMYDERMLHFLSRLAEMHVDPTVSDPGKIKDIPDDEISEGEGRPQWSRDDLNEHGHWPGLYKDVGIFTEHEWHLLMCKCLASMEIPLADAGSLTTGPSVDNQASFEIGRLPKPEWRIPSLARIIVYSMAPDGPPAPTSTAPTPYFTPLPSGANTPRIHTTTLREYLSAPLVKTHSKGKTYLAGSKALDSLARMIASTESFFHPSNSGAWTADLSAFIKYIVYEFNKRWHEEQLPDCNTPTNRRLTKLMKHDLVKCLRTVALLAIFSQDSNTVVNVQSCLKSMTLMEPNLILHPILERAVPSLEALEETQRTIAVIKALGAVVPAIVSREVYYPGAKFLVPILQLLIPGIDLNDPTKTLCTTAFLSEISQYIQFGDLTTAMPEHPDSEPTVYSSTPLPSFSASALEGMENMESIDMKLSEEEEALLRDSTRSFADWVTSFIHRVIQLLENLPEEGVNGSAGAPAEVQVVDAVTGACSQICVHLSEPLYDLVLNMVFEYASTNVRSNAVRAIHQLVECIANADPVKTLAKFFPYCSHNIRVELENGASSSRTTSSSSPLPSDATLHWNLAILRGTLYNDGRAALKYKDDFMSLFRLLQEKAFSKRGFSWGGKLLSSLLLTLTHTYPLENKFVNPGEWNSDEFRWNHHRYWGKLYKPEEVKLSWHVPNLEELDFALEIFKELVEPALELLNGLLEPGVVRDAAWRNDFCRHLSFIRNAFSGIPTLVKEAISPEQFVEASRTSDILNEIPEMIASLEPLNSGFCLTDPNDPRYQYITSLRQRFGCFLHRASVSLRQQGEENTVDAVYMLIKAVRTHMLEHGDSRDSYYANQDQYASDLNVARQYAGQKIWPRAVYVRRARFYHSARLRWNSIERLRNHQEDCLIDDLVEWSLWHYAIIRESSQSLLDSLSTVYDGVRGRILPVLYKALEPGVDDDRMKGSLWTLNCPSIGKYAVSEPTLRNELFKRLLNCQHNEKPSIQECVSIVSNNCLDNFVEPCYLVYDVNNRALDQAVSNLQEGLVRASDHDDLVDRCRKMRIERIRLMNQAAQLTTTTTLDIANSKQTHWRYAIVATRCLRTLIRRDVPSTPSHMRFFLEKSHDSHPTIRYYAQRGIMKCLRNVKLRTFCKNSADLALARNQNPLKQTFAIEPSHSLTENFLTDFKTPYDATTQDQTFIDKVTEGWLAWKHTVTVYRMPHPSKSTFLPWEDASVDVVATVRESAMDPSFWKDLSTYYSEENNEDAVAQDNIACVKSIFQLLEEEPLEVLKPTLETLIADKDQNKQRAAAELLAGLLGGSKHWPTNAQRRLWEWFTPHIRLIFGHTVKSDTLPVWSSFLEYVFYRKDPRRVQPLVDYLVQEFHSMDYNGESSFDAIKILSFFRQFYEELNWKFSAWMDDMVQRCWPEISGEHDDVRAYVGEILAFSAKVKWQPNPSLPTAEAFVRECRVLPIDYDIMGTRGTYHQEQVLELVEKFKVWRKERVPGVRAFQSTYDKVGVTVCKWLFETIHDTNAMSGFDYILPLMPEIFRFTEVNDNDDLVQRANTLLFRMCGVTPPRAMVNTILDTIFEAIQTSPSWKVRLKALPLVQVFYFRQVPLISEIKVVEILEVLCKCLGDEVVEVREMAATTLSGILRLSPRHSIMTLKDRFVRLVKDSHIPSRQSPGYNKAVRERHAAILGICALVDSYPYTVEKWMPELLTNVLAEHTYDPIPISTTVSKCASNFKKTHQDTWHEDSKRFNEDQLAALSTLLTGSSYYA